MIVVAPDPSLDEIYPIDGFNIAFSVFDVTLFVTSEIKPDESKDIRVSMHGLDDRNPLHGILDMIFLLATIVRMVILVVCLL
jgi:hypothetical protein